VSRLFSHWLGAGYIPGSRNPDRQRLEVAQRSQYLEEDKKKCIGFK